MARRNRDLKLVRGRDGAATPLLVGGSAAVRRVAAALVLTMTLAGCQSGEGARRPTSTAYAPLSQGRRIGADADAGSNAVAAAVRFARGYLSFQAGRLPAEQVPNTSKELRAALRRLRVPPASRSRQEEIAGARLERIDAGSARVTVSVRSIDERLTYPLPIDLLRRDGRWWVLSAGDDA
jgi:hypothetical protein